MSVLYFEEVASKHFKRIHKAQLWRARYSFAIPLNAGHVVKIEYYVLRSDDDNKCQELRWLRKQLYSRSCIYVAEPLIDQLLATRSVQQHILDWLFYVLPREVVRRLPDRWRSTHVTPNAFRPPSWYTTSGGAGAWRRSGRSFGVGVILDAGQGIYESWHWRITGSTLSPASLWMSRSCADAPHRSILTRP